MTAMRQTEIEAMRQLTIPARYWDDFSERAPVDHPSQMAVEIARAGSRVTVSATAEQMVYLLGDAKFYADGNTDGTDPSVLRGARRLVDLCEQGGLP